MTDQVTKALEQLPGEPPPPRKDLSETEKDRIVARLGPRTVRNLVKAKKDFPLRRIPFLFSSLDTQDVVDVLANNFDHAIERAVKKT